MVTGEGTGGVKRGVSFTATHRHCDCSTSNLWIVSRTASSIVSHFIEEGVLTMEISSRRIDDSCSIRRNRYRSTVGAGRDDAVKRNRLAGIDLVLRTWQIQCNQIGYVERKRRVFVSGPRFTNGNGASFLSSSSTSSVSVSDSEQAVRWSFRYQ